MNYNFKLLQDSHIGVNHKMAQHTSTKRMIELFTADTPNGWKISIMLEEIDFKYKLTKVNLSGDQFKPEFKKISPFNKIPVIKLNKF